MANKVGGRIVRIKAKGFMTYDDVEIIPHKGLNLIIGLNGSGKSSIMAAICLGLGGKPSFTGRSVHLSEFIKFNHTEAIIEIELESPRGRNDVIRRHIQADKQVWYLNNKLVLQNEIMSIVKRYNIDMGNLCQFLPQEKVAEFSKMDKKQRLVNMIQAIGDPNLVDLFDELKTLRNEYNHFEKELNELDNNTTSEIKINERLKPEIEKQEERIKLENELKVLRVRRRMFDYHIFLEKLDEIKAKRQQLCEELSKKQATSNTLKTQKAHLSSEFHEYQTQVQQLQEEISRHMQNLIKNSGSLGAYHEEVDNAKINFENRMLEKEEQRSKLTALSRQIEGFKVVLRQKIDEKPLLAKKLEQNAKEYENVKQQLSYCDSELQRINLNKNSLEYKKKSKLEEINRISNEEDKKYEILQAKYPDTYKALQWLQQNESSFRARIWPPSLVSIKVDNYEYCKYIENAVAERDLLMFVCEDKEDLEKFLKVIKHEKKLSVNVTMVPNEKLDDFESELITPEMRSLGIHCYLIDLFTAPEAVMRVLCKLNRVHKVPVCTEKGRQNIDSILRYSNLFFIPTEKISGKRSHYGQKNMSIRRDDLIKRNILPNIVDNSEALQAAKADLQKIEDKLNEYRPQCEKLEMERTHLERQQEQLRKEKNDINTENRKLNELHMKLAQLTESYKRKSKEIIDEEKEKTIVTVTIRKVNNKKMEILTEMHKIMKEIIRLKRLKATTILCLSVSSEKISSLEEKISNLGNQINNLKANLSAADSEKARIKAEGMKVCTEIRAMKEEADKISDIRSRVKRITQEIFNGKGIEDFNEIEKDLNTYQNHTLEEIEQLISNTEAQIELTHEDITPILAEFKRREQAILSMQDKVENLKSKIGDLKNKMGEKKEKWLPPLKARIETVNQKFSKYYKMLKCAGEISLDQTDDTDDFPNYGLQLKLKYRVDEEFMELSQTHHSGGECSVAAIIFILSLQELTDVPFRCIDEINQGMDAINERKIYQLVADAASSGSCSQYFLLTPKLLMDLSYHKDVAVHIIFNSPFLKGKLNVKEHLKIAKANRK